MKKFGKTKYYHPYNKGGYLHKGPHDLGMSYIPPSERCEGFRDIWNRVFKQVMEYWDKVPVEDIHEFDDYDDVKENY